MIVPISYRFPALLLAITLVHFPAVADEEEELPFSGEVISRVSLDEVPRSLAICQNKSVWLGYSLDDGLPFRVWKAQPGKLALVEEGRATRSEGSMVFYREPGESWTLKRKGNVLPSRLRYLECSHLEGRVVLSWAVIHGATSIRIQETIPLRPKLESPAAFREIEISGLPASDVLSLPTGDLEKWSLRDLDGQVLTEIAINGRYQLVLP